MTKTTVWLSCGVVRAELEELLQQGKITGRLCFLDSMLHMVPLKMDDVIAKALEHSEPDNADLVLVFGDCCPRMLDLVRRFNVSRVKAINCAQLLAGDARYRELMRKESFMLLPEWALRWREIMQDHLGLSPKVARELMGEHRRELVYFDTGLVPVPRAELDACAEFTGLPCRVEQIGLDHLLKSLLEAQRAPRAAGRTPDGGTS